MPRPLHHPPRSPHDFCRLRRRSTRPREPVTPVVLGHPVRGGPSSDLLRCAATTRAPVASIRTTNETIAHSDPIGHSEVIIDPNGPFMINCLLLSQVRRA